MALTLSSVFVFAVATWVCWLAFGLRITHALCAGLCGFFVAETGIAPAVRSGVAAVFRWVGSWDL